MRALAVVLGWVALVLGFAVGTAVALAQGSGSGVADAVAAIGSGSGAALGAAVIGSGSGAAGVPAVAPAGALAGALAGAPVDGVVSIGGVLSGVLMTQANILLMAAVWAVIQIVRRAMPTKIFKSQLWVRFEPLAALVLCSAGVWIPGQQLATQSAADRVLIGLVLGFGVSQLHKVFSQSIFGQDSRLTEGKKP